MQRSIGLCLRKAWTILVTWGKMDAKVADDSHNQVHTANVKVAIPQADT